MLLRSVLETVMLRVKDISPMKILLFGYCLVILLGTLLLSLPMAVADGNVPSPFTAFFTATSAACVTGLVLEDTYTYWSTFGQAVILSLIQVGGLGFMTLCISFVSMTRKKIGMSSRIVMQSAISAPQIGGIVRMTRFVLLGSLLLEAVGAVLLAFYFIPRLGIGRGLWYSLFHSISAFCNAGFDLMGYRGTFSSLTTVAASPLINFTIIALIIVGGLGFFVWADLLNAKFRFSQMAFHTKIVVTVTLSLIVGGSLLFLGLEHDSPAFAGLSSGGQRYMAALFQGVTVRTAGFNTVDLLFISETGLFLMILLMFIGGSPGGTAGGIKTTTFAVLMLSVAATMRRRKHIIAFGRRMEDTVARTAACVLISYLFLSCAVAMFISHTEDVALLLALFESVSAIATVGLSCGLTPELGPISCTLLALLMLFGRAGSITILRAIASDRTYVGVDAPQEKIQIG